jgi:hypothetical protein
LREALWKGGLEAAAKVDGRYVVDFDPNPDWLNFGVENLTRNSEVVAVGVPLRNRGRLTTDGGSAVTQYEVMLQDVLKGNVAPGSIIKVALPGGKVSFADGSTAEVRTPKFRKMVNGKTYLLYLNANDDEQSSYDLTAGPQGLLELSADGVEVNSHAAEKSRIKEQVKGKNSAEFLKEARKQAKKWPQPSKCCK